MANWNGDKANDYFIKLFNSVNVEGAKLKIHKSTLHKNLYDLALANHDLYYECAISSWTKEKFSNFLQKEIKTANSDCINPEKYLNSYKKNIQDLKNEFESGELLKKIISS